MDLNQLYFDHQLLLIRAGASASRTSRNEWEIGASHVAARIGCVQRRLGAAAAPAWETLSGRTASSVARQGCSL